MYIPKQWKMETTKEMVSFITENGFASLITGDLEASHLPLLIHENEGECGVLYGHFAKANTHWECIDDAKVLAIFSGPHAYISPAWYVESPAVPTWNYSAVHVKGTVKLTDTETTLKIISEAVEKYDGQLSIPKEFMLKLSNSIVGFKIHIESIVGKEKLGQHRTKEDQRGVLAALQNHTKLEEKLLYQYMVKRNIGTGS